MNGAALEWVPEMTEYFRLPEKSTHLNLRVPESLKADLLNVVRLWKLMAKAAGAKDEAIEDITLTHVCERLLRIGVDGVWAQAGSKAGLSGAPQNDEEWAALARAIASKRK